MTYYTAGNIGRFSTGNAEEFGQCPECGDGADSGIEEDEAPLFRDGDRFVCAACHPDDDDEKDVRAARAAEQAVTS